MFCNVFFKNLIKTMTNVKKLVLLGDMLELGGRSQVYHKRISKFINNSDIDKTFVYGNKSLETFKFLKKEKKGGIIKDIKSFDSKISEVIKNGDFLMIKGSNATKLHEVSKKFLGGRLNAL